MMLPSHRNPTRSPLKRERAPSSPQQQQQQLFEEDEKNRQQNLSRIGSMNQTIDLLFQVCSTSKQEAAIIAAIAVFDHSDETLCNAAVEAGASHALTLQLGYALHKMDSIDSSLAEAQGGNVIVIVRNILRALSLVYQCSNIVRQQSFQSTGEELIPLIISSIVKSKQQQQQQKKVNPEGYDDMIVFHGMRVLHLLSFVDSAKLHMATFRSIIEIIVTVLRNDSHDTARCDAIGILRNFSTHTEEYKVKLVRFPQLLHSLVRFCCFNTRQHVQVGEDVSFIVRNLSLCKLAKVHIAEHGDIINIMVKLSADRNIRTKREAISAILGLALVVENRVLLMRQSEGGISFALARILQSEHDHVVRRRAARALRCMASVDTVDLILSQNFTIETFSKVALFDNSEEVRIESARALSSWAMVQELIPISPRYDTLLRALIDIASSSNCTACVDSVSAAILHQAKVPDNHFAMANNRPLMAALLKLVFQEEASAEAKENVIGTILHFSTTQQAAAQILLHQGSSVLTALVHVLLSDAENVSHHCKNSSVDTIIHLYSSRGEESRRDIAKHKGLMIALLRYSATSQDMIRKAAAKKTIMSLVPFM